MSNIKALVLACEPPPALGLLGGSTSLIFIGELTTEDAAMNENSTKAPANAIQEALERVMFIVQNPKTCWDRLHADPRGIPELYTTYLALFAGASAICTFLGLSMVGIPVPLIGTIRVPVFTAFLSAVLGGIIPLVTIYVMALAMENLAPKFGG